MGAFSVRVELSIAGVLHEVRWLRGAPFVLQSGEQCVTVRPSDEGYHVEHDGRLSPVGFDAPVAASLGIATLLVESDLPPETHHIPRGLDWVLLGLHGISAAAFVLCALVILAIPIHPADLTLGAKVIARVKVTLDSHGAAPTRPPRRSKGALSDLQQRHLAAARRHSDLTQVPSRQPDLQTPSRGLGRRVRAAARPGATPDLPALTGLSEFQRLIGRDSVFGDAQSALEGLGAPDPSSGNGGSQTYGGLIGSGGGGTGGTIGLGGGGTGYGTIGLGRYGTVGRGRGPGVQTGTITSQTICRYPVRSVRALEFPEHKCGTTCTLHACNLHITQCLDKEIIRRVVRAHMNEVRYCYEKGLIGDAALEGRVTIGFTVAEDGTVSASELRESSLPDSAVGVCIAGAIERWTFPKRECGGDVVVSYPFLLKSAE